MLTGIKVVPLRRHSIPHNPAAPCFGGGVYKNPDIARHAAKLLEKITGDYCEVRRFGEFPHDYYIARYDPSGHEACLT